MFRTLTKINQDTKDTIYEKWYPFLGSVCVLCFSCAADKYFQNIPLDNLLNAVISFASILIGFIGVLVTLFFSQAKTKIVKTILKYPAYKNGIEKYFVRSCQSGFGIIVLSLMMYLRTGIVQISYMANAWGVLKRIWIFMLSYFLLASYRIISLVIRILFLSLDGEDGDAGAEDEIVVTMSEIEKKQLRDKHSD